MGRVSSILYRCAHSLSIPTDSFAGDDNLNLSKNGDSGENQQDLTAAADYEMNSPGKN